MRLVVGSKAVLANELDFITCFDRNELCDGAAVSEQLRHDGVSSFLRFDPLVQLLDRQLLRDV